MMRLKKITLLFCAMCISLALSAQAQSNQSSTNKWTPKEVIHASSAYNFTFSPDGKLVVWMKRRPSSEKHRFVSDLYLTHLDIKQNGHYKTVQLTRTEDSDYSPVFSKDGETIYFLSSRDEGNHIWAMSIYGGAPHSVYKKDVSLSDLKRLGDHRLSFTAKEGKSLYDMQTDNHHDDTIDIEDSTHFRASRVFAFNITNKEAHRLTDNRYPVYQYAVSHDGKWMVTGHIRSTHYAADNQPKPTYYLWNLTDGSKKQILEGDFQTPGGFIFTKNDDGFYFSSVKSSDPQWGGAGISELYYFDISDSSPVKVDLKNKWGLGGGITVTGDDVLALLANGATDKLAYYEKQGDHWQRTDVASKDYSEHVSPEAISPDGDQLIYSYSTASVMPQYRIGDFKQHSLAKGDMFVSLNKNVADKPIAKSEVFHWKGAKGDSVDGILYYPNNYQKGRKYPLIVSIHGGPSGNDQDHWANNWAYAPNIYTQMGAFVLKPNYHGSSNHGLAFEESIKGHYYELEIPDIVSGVNALIDKGMVNRDSLGIKGWSNGAILTIMSTIQHPDLFKVAAEGAGDVDWVSDYGPTSFGVQFDQSYFLGAPWDNVDGKNYNPVYINKSPLFDVEKLRTPTIIFQGGKDRKVTRDQSWEYYRAIQQVGKAPVKFLWFPGEPHGPRQIPHQLRKMQAELAWFKKYLWGDKDTINPSFKEDSPLGQLITKQKTAKSGAYVGVMAHGKLIPEVVATDSSDTKIGRFEVTNQQYKAFDSDYSFSPVNANHPVTGISYQQAKAYISWLSKLTHQSYRLPNSKEADMFNDVAQKSGTDENTLNRWAGYNITKDEARQLQPKLQAVDDNLLMPVGSFKAEKVKGAALYDLGGNAAEMYNKSGQEGIYGYSVVSFVDQNSTPTAPDQAFIGFRVIRDQ